jgi:hypothetical protein
MNSVSETLGVPSDLSAPLPTFSLVSDMFARSSLIVRR